jgi:uncharacterized protein (TIGR00251 family)
LSGLTVRERAGCLRLDVRVQPRASRNELAGVHGGALKVRLQAPPVDGAANEALVAFLAESLGVPRAAVRVVAGATSRAKVVEIEGVRRTSVEELASLR